MEIKKLKKEFLRVLTEKYPEENIEVEETVAEKNNGIKKIGFIIKKEDSAIAPVFYVEEVLERINQGELDLDDYLEEMLTNYEQSCEYLKDRPSDILEVLKNGKYIAVAINADENVLKDIPHKKLDGDIAIAVRCFVDGGGNGSALITNEVLKELPFGPEELIETAINNAIDDEYRVVNLADVIAESMGVEGEALAEMREKTKMYTVTNTEKYFGATGIYVNEDLRSKIYEMFGEEYYIIPSSVHETLVYPVMEKPLQETLQMIRGINESTVSEEEFLSNEVCVVGEDLHMHFYR